MAFKLILAKSKRQIFKDTFLFLQAGIMKVYNNQEIHSGLQKDEQKKK